jgi:hypothetical protein
MSDQTVTCYYCGQTRLMGQAHSCPASAEGNVNQLPEVARLTAEVERLREFIGNIGPCGLAQSHGCGCPFVEPARDLLAGKK